MGVQNDVRVTLRVDKELKERAEILFERLGLNMSTALNVFLRKAVDESAIPFPISTAKSGTLSDEFSADKITDAFTASVRSEIAENQRKGFPIARYDAGKKQAYLETANGAREYVHG